MVKQYIYINKKWPNYEIYLYEDGKKIYTIQTDQLDIDDVIESIEAKGYEKAYTNAEVEYAKMKYERMREKQLVIPVKVENE